ncbi:MAG: hypothetical protein IT328_20765 [Caldilineaceae bacterium]|nr:hypothetical protein [Caldilineaceae bacterium]
MKLLFDRIYGRAYWLVLPLLTIPALWPLLADGLPARFDRGLHLMRLAWLDQHLRQGTLFPRWVPEMMLGRGYPLFNFYGAGVYYLTEALHLLGLSLYDASVATLIILMLLAGFGMYLFARDIFSQPGSGMRAAWASLVAAIAYVYAPYFLTVNIYQRGAIAEATAQALMPWVLWSVRRIFTSQAPGLWAMILALLLATLVFSHTLMLLIFPPLLAGYVLIQWLQNGRQRQALGWAIGGLLLAIGISAFFWLPLILEREYLGKHAFNIVRGAFLPRSMWTWETFVADQWLYTYERPPRLALVPLLLGVLGAVLTLIHRRTWETWYLLISAIVAGALVGAWARPLWAGSEILLSVQSPWRLLTLITPVLAIFTGALVAYLPIKPLRVVFAASLIGLIIYTTFPRLGDVPLFSRTDTVLSPQTLAQLEYEQGVETGGEGSTFVLEFRPRWASRTLLFTDPANLTAPPLELQPTQANAYATTLNVTSAEAAPLRFNRFYFPGWQIRLADGTLLPTYPSTNLGLLTVDLPVGSHQLTLTWTGTPIQQIAALLSLITLALLAGICWWQRRRRLAILPVALLAFGLAATFSRPALAPVQAPAEPIEAHGIRLLGYRLQQSDPTRITLYPSWYVLSGGPNANLQARWQLRDETGAVRSEIVSAPYFNASSPRSWPPGTLVEDAYAIPLPPELPTGSYEIVLQLEADGSASPSSRIGTVTLASPTPPQLVEMIATNALFDDEIYLAGYATALDDQPQAATDGATPVLNAGDVARYQLYWQATKTPAENYHSYIHLIDATGHAIYQSDQLPGPWFRPPRAWDRYTLQQDTHRLRIPPDAPGGLYWPVVGLYEIRQMDRMAVSVDGQAVEGDVFRLPPVKVVGAPANPTTVHAAQFDDGFRLLGYDLQLPEGGLHPGASFQVTLYYRSDAKSGKDYTRFFHLYSSELGLAAQADSPPQAGVNPTQSWIPEETVIDPITLQIADTATPGEYQLFTGFYDAQAGGARLGVQDEAGQPLPDGGVILGTVTVHAEGE